jgi:hypothetical protein
MVSILSNYDKKGAICMKSSECCLGIALIFLMHVAGERILTASSDKK